MRSDLFKHLGVLGVSAVVMGCRADGTGGGFTLFKPTGEKWSIQCLEFHGAGSRNLCEAVAEDLRDTVNIVAGQVLCMHDEGRSRLYYGEYYRRIDPATGKLDMPAKMASDLNYIKTLRDAGAEGGAKRRVRGVVTAGGRGSRPPDRASRRAGATRT